MISLAFVNNKNEQLIASNPFFCLERAMVQLSNEVDEQISNYIQLNDRYIFESELMSEIDDDKTIYLEAQRGNVFESIGNAVIAIFNKIKNLITGAIKSIQEAAFSSKSNEKKMKALLDDYKKNDPEKYKSLKNDIVLKFDSGDLALDDARSIKDVSKLYDEIVELSKKKDVKPNTLRGKIDEMKRKYNNKLDKGTISKTAKAVTTVVAAVVAIATFKSKILDSKKRTAEYNNTMCEYNTKTIKAIKELQSYNNGEYAADSLTKAQLLKNANFWINGEYMKLISKEQGHIDKIDKGWGSWIARHERDKKNKFLNNVDRGYDIAQDKEARRRQDERDKNIQDARDKANGTGMGQHDVMRRYKKEDDRKLRRDTKIRTAAQSEINDINILSNKQHRKAVRQQEKIKQQGREEGTTPKKQGVQKIEIVNNNKNKNNKKNP